MSEWATHENEGGLEAPEQPEPPRIRSEHKKIILPADADLERLVHDSAPEILIAVAADARLTEDLALALLNHRDLPREALEALSKNGRPDAAAQSADGGGDASPHCAACVSADDPPSLYV